MIIPAKTLPSLSLKLPYPFALFKTNCPLKQLPSSHSNIPIPFFSPSFNPPLYLFFSFFKRKYPFVPKIYI